MSSSTKVSSLLDKRTLAEKNPHDLDKNIVFDEEKHTYTVHGVRYPGSVSGFYHEFFPSFNARETVDKYFDSWSRNKESSYYTFINYWKNRMGVSDHAFIKQEIVATWSATGNAASGAGTRTHKNAENRLNNLDYEADSPEMRQLTEWLATLPPTWEPFRTEWSIYDEESLMCGQLDALFVDTKTGEYHLVDWKRVNPMKEEGFRGQMGFGPFSSLPASNLGHYTAQVGRRNPKDKESRVQLHLKLLCRALCSKTSTPTCCARTTASTSPRCAWCRSILTSPSTASGCCSTSGTASKRRSRIGAPR